MGEKEPKNITTDTGQVANAEKPVYAKNEKYNQDDICKLMKIYHMAMEAGDNATVQDAFNKIYYFIEKYVYKTLWDNYRNLMQNSYHRDDIVQEVWLKIFNELKNYDPDKGAITTFIAPWIKHVVSEYASRNFRKASVYYANAMKRVNGAQNYCRQYGLNPDDIATLINLTGLSEATVKNTLDLMSKKDSVSYEALVDAGADYTAQLKGPEESYIEAESEENLKELLKEALTEEELMLLELLMNPENVSKRHSSYREIVEQIPGSNIPQIKRKISRITTKLKNNKRFEQLYPYIIAQEKALETNYLPVLDGDEYDASDLYEEFDQDPEDMDGWKKAGQPKTAAKATKK